MLPSPLQRLADRLGVRASGNPLITGISIDSRAIAANDLFVALKGQRDGHDFIEQALSRGAAGALVSHPTDRLPAITVSDTEVGLTALAHSFRDDFSGTVLAMTGSQGKTSTRGFVAAIVSAAVADPEAEVLVTTGNLNNHLGVPLTLSRLRDTHRFAVLELGASAVGDIQHLVGIARPHHSILLNARAAHLEGFGSREGVVQGKGEIIDGTDPNGVVVLNRDEPAYAVWVERAGTRKTWSFGRSHADVTWRALDDQQVELMTPAGRIDVRLPTLGVHFMENAAAATALCLAAGLPLEAVASGLARAQIEPGRMTPIALPNGRLIDDTYNASPDAVRAAIDWLAAQPGRRALVMGHLAELGADAVQSMHALGAYAKQQSIEHLITVGDAEPIALGFGPDAVHFATLELLESNVAQLIEGVETVLVKGSRSSRMDRVVTRLRQGQGDQ